MTLLDAAARWRWLVWIAAALLIYHPSFQTRPIFDDTAHVEFAAQQGWQLFHAGPIFFRPLERVLIGLSWMLCGDNFWLVKLAALGVLVAKVALVYELASRIVAPRRTWTPFVIALLYLFHPMQVSAVEKIDTFSEDIASLFALLIVLIAINATAAGKNRAAHEHAIAPMRSALLAAAMVFLGMLSKEAFAGIAAMTPVMFAAAIGVSTRESRRTLLFLIIAESVAAVGYFMLRHAGGFSLAGAQIASDRYALHLGSNVLINVAAELVSICFPGSTLAVFVQFNLVHIVISVSLLVALLVLYRTRLVAMAACLRAPQVQQHKATVIVLIAVLAALFPTCLISQLVSENQTALALPFVMLLMLACPLAAHCDAVDERPYAAGPSTCLSAIALVWMASAATEKVLAAHEASNRAYSIGDQIVAKFHESPTSTLTVCFAPSMRAEPKKYSIFSMPDDLAAYFQLYRLRIRTPAPVIQVVDMRLGSEGDRPHCSLLLSGPSVSR